VCVLICLERGADLHTAQLMPLPLTVSCFSKIQTGFTFLVPADLSSPGKGPLNGCVCVCVPVELLTMSHTDYRPTLSKFDSEHISRPTGHMQGLVRVRGRYPGGANVRHSSVATTPVRSSFRVAGTVAAGTWLSSPSRAALTRTSYTWPESIWRRSVRPQARPVAE